MKDFKKIPEKVKGIVDRVIATLVYSTDKSLIYKEPEKNFTRTRKLPILELVYLLLSRGAQSLSKCLCAEFDPGNQRASKSALVQQQAKFKVEFFEQFFRKLQTELSHVVLFKKKYRLLAVDGSSFSVPCKCKECYNSTQKPHGRKGKALYTIHLHSFYDVLTRMFEDVIIETGSKVNEQAAFVKMAERLDKKNPVIFTADRAYACYNLIAHLALCGFYYVIRVKDLQSGTSLVKYWWKLFNGPEKKPGEVSVHVKFTRVGGPKVRKDKSFKILPPNMNFDLLPDDNPFGNDIAPEDIPAEYYHELSFRLVRVRINKKGAEGKEEFETLITNLPVDTFPPRVLKTIYHLRWGIELGYRELKYDEKAIFFHSQKKECILEELYISLAVHNIVSYICSFSGNKMIAIKKESLKEKDKNKKYSYAINRSKAASIIHRYLSLRCHWSSEHIVEELARELEAIRDERKFDRKLVPKGVIPFAYRSA